MDVYSNRLKTRFFWGFILAIFIYVSPVIALSPNPDYTSMKTCYLSGGIWLNDDCVCPPYIKSANHICYIKDPTEACEEKGGHFEIHRDDPWTTVATLIYSVCVNEQGKEIEVKSTRFTFLWWVAILVIPIIYIYKKKIIRNKKETLK